MNSIVRNFTTTVFLLLACYTTAAFAEPSPRRTVSVKEEKKTVRAQKEKRTASTTKEEKRTSPVTQAEKRTTPTLQAEKPTSPVTQAEKPIAPTLQEEKRPTPTTQVEAPTAPTLQEEVRTPPITLIQGTILKMEVKNGRTTLWMVAGDENLAPLQNLKPEQFTVTETVNGVKRVVPTQAISLTQGGEQQWVTVLLRDVSSSLAPALELVNAAIRTYIDDMPPGQVAVIDFGEHVSVRSKLTTDKNALKNALNLTIVEGATAFYDGLWRAINDLQKIPAHRAKIAIVFTDGEDTSSTHSLEEVLQAAKASAIPIFCIGLGEAQENVLRQIAWATHGLYAYAPDAVALTSAYTKIAKLLNRMSLVSFPTQARSRDTVSITAELNYTGGGKRVATQFETGVHRLP